MKKEKASLSDNFNLGADPDYIVVSDCFWELYLKSLRRIKDKQEKE